MAAFTHCPGPIDHYVRFRDGTTVYLGSASQAPEVEAELKYIDIFNDLGGRSVPFQRVFDGEAGHTITTTMNRFDMTVWNAIKDYTHNANLIGVEGSVERGTLAVGNSDFELILRYTYAAGGTLALAQSDFPVGRRYFSTILGGYKESTVGTRIMEIAVAFLTTPIFNTATRTFTLYTETALGTLPAPN